MSRRVRQRRIRPKRDTGQGISPPTRSLPQPTPKNAKIIREIDSILNEPRYEDFVQKLGVAAKDPKLRAVLAGGLMDGELMDDMIHHRDIMRMGKNLVPIQHEIDLDDSLRWVGQNPDNIPLMLKGGTLGPEHFGNNPIVASYGQYIIDGHHRWSQVYMINPEARLEVINLAVVDPKAAMRKSQVTIAAMTGEVPVARVEPSKNVFTMRPEEIRKAIPRHLSPAFYKAFYKTYPDRFRTKDDVHNHIYGNIIQMRRLNPPQTDIGRELMPQYGKVGARRGAEALTAGEINIKPPYIKRKGDQDG